MSEGPLLPQRVHRAHKSHPRHSGNHFHYFTLNVNMYCILILH